MRGRPKKLNRKEVIEIAMYSYWEEGTQNISLNEVCRRAGISKPGLYREFGNEDGLMKEVLKQYQLKVLDPLHDYLVTSLTVQEITQKLVSTIKDGVDRPLGCLFVKMREVQPSLGEQTMQELVNCHKKTLSAYRKWALKLIKSKNISSDFSSQLVSKYIDVQINNASALLSRGERFQEIEAILVLSFSALLDLGINVER
jgi:AcrR family transcriptional regulator